MRDDLLRYFASGRAPGVTAAFLFGSHARGTTHASSDVDVAVLFDRRVLPARADRAAAAERLGVDLIGVTHCNHVDVLALNDAPPELAVAALDAGVPLTPDASAEAVRAFTRDVRLRLADVRPFLDRSRRAKLETLRR